MDSVRNNTDGLTQARPGQVRAASKGRRVKQGNWEKWKVWNKREREKTGKKLIKKKEEKRKGNTNQHTEQGGGGAAEDTTSK